MIIPRTDQSYRNSSLKKIIFIALKAVSDIYDIIIPC